MLGKTLHSGKVEFEAVDREGGHTIELGVYLDIVLCTRYSVLKLNTTQVPKQRVPFVVLRVPHHGIIVPILLAGNFRIRSRSRSRSFAHRNAKQLEPSRAARPVSNQDASWYGCDMHETLSCNATTLAFAWACQKTYSAPNLPHGMPGGSPCLARYSVLCNTLHAL